MSETPDPRAGIRRFLADAEAADAMTCADAERLLPGFVAAEERGEDVDQQPIYTALRRHLNSCPDCALLYDELTQPLDDLLAFATAHPTPVPPAFVAEVPQSRGVTVRVVSAVQQLFELVLTGPQRIAPVPLARGRQIFAGVIDSVAGAPVVAVTLDPVGQDVTVHVTIRSVPPQRWQVTLLTNTNHYVQQSDAQGAVQFEYIPQDELGDLHVRCQPLV